MAIFKTSRKRGRCPKCGSTNVEVEYRKVNSNKSSTITRKWIKCNNCGYEG